MTTIQTQFEQFHKDNPQVYLALEALAATWLMHHHRCGIGMLWERLRWESGMRTFDDLTPWELNNNYRSRYVRILLARNPEWRGCFATRKLVSK